MMYARLIFSLLMICNYSGLITGQNPVVKINYRCWIQLNSKPEIIRGGIVDAGPTTLSIVGEYDFKKVDFDNYMVDYKAAEIRKLFLQKRGRPVEAAFVLGGVVGLSTTLALLYSKDDLFSIPGIAWGTGLVTSLPFVAIGALTGGPRKLFRWNNIEEYQSQRRAIRRHMRLE